MRTRHGKIPIVVLRIAGMYSDHCDSAPLAQQIQRVDERMLTSKVFPGDTSHGQAFVHIDDVVDTIVRTVERRGDLPHDATLLVGEPGRPPSYDELQREFARLLHGETDWPTRSIPKAIAKSGAWLQDKAEDAVPDAIDQGAEPFIKPFMTDLADDHFELDTAHARELIGWQPRHRPRQPCWRQRESSLAAVIDETPAAYKDIDAVMEAQRDLVDVVHTLKQVVCVNG